jgi:hypothetical protein
LKKVNGEKVIKSVADPEVIATAKRKRYTASYKLDMIRRVDQLKEKGTHEVGAFLRQEGLYSSNITRWRKQLEAGELGKSRRGRHTKSGEVLRKEIVRLKRKLASMEKRAHQAELLVELQKKISEILRIAQPEAEAMERSWRSGKGRRNSQ